ncbi:hypothetical protein LAZ67_11001220, partial [Cordylochernes scorpioides]
MIRIDTAMAAVGGAKYFSTLDLASGYYQLKLDINVTKCLAFQTPFGKFEMSRLPQGCKISSNVFQREMHRILSGLLGKNCQCFIDDVLIYSESLEQHLADLTEVFDRLRKYGLQVRPSKCQLFQEEVTFLGHRVDKDGIHPKENNIEKIKNMSPPKTVSGVRRFLGAVGFYRKFIAGFSEIAAPLYELTKKGTRYEWNEAAQRAYDKLKTCLSSAPILIHPDYREKFLIFTDASDIGCGGMLSQLKNGTPQPISFYSHKFRGAELNYSTIEKECLAIIMAIEQFDYYIYGQQVEIYCDHKPLQYLKSLENKNRRLMKWALMLQDRELTFFHVKGKENAIADWLSRDTYNTEVAVVDVYGGVTTIPNYEKFMLNCPVWKNIYKRALSTDSEAALVPSPCPGIGYPDIQTRPSPLMVETRSGKMQDPAQERIKAEESAKPQPGATIGRDASSDPVVLNPNIDIPKYDRTEDPRPWIESLEEIGFLYHWADYIISRYAAMNMIGSAKTWLNLHKVSFTSWENFKSRLIEDFASDANKEEMRMRLNRIQQWNEPAIRFAEDILVLCNKVDPQMEEDTKINWVIGGLKKEYSFALHLNPPKNTNELLEICKKLDLFEKNYQERAEKSKALYNGPRSPRPHHQEQRKNATSFRRPYQNTSKPQAPAPRYYQNTSKPQAPTPRYYQNKPLPQVSAPRRSYTPNPEPKPVYPSKTYNKNPNSNRNRTEDGRPICFKCNKPGHVARYCRVRFVRIVEEDPIVTQDKVEEEIRMDNGTQKSRPLLYSDPAEVNLMEESEQKEHEEPQFQINENLAYTEKEQLKQVLERYEDLFSSGLGRSNLAKHRIDTEGAKPIKHKPYRVSAKEREIIKEQIDEMLRDGIIRPSSSPWSFPVILVKKRDGKYRFCVDYRKLNDVTVKDVYPIPRIDEVLDTLQGSKYFSAIDLKSGYWQVEVEEKDKEKTAFTTAHGLYEFNVMPFGLCNAPATFERNMENMLGNLRWQICLCYLDDVIIYSSDFSTHLKRIEAVLKCFREANLKLNNKKCQFAFEELEILGHITNQHGIKPAEHNIKAIRDFPRPKKIKEVQSFLGMCSYYRKFIKGFSKIADPLTSLIKKNVPFTWTENQEKAFQTLKVALINPPILGHFDPNAITYIHTDASNIGLGAKLVQKFGDKEKVISYLSRTLRKPEQNYSTTEKECLAVVWSMSKLRPYLYGRHFKIVTDHHALCWLKNLKDPTGRLARWALKIQEYHFEIIHKSGKKHLDADGLSRGPLPENEWDEDYERLFLNQIIDEKDDFIENIKENLSGNKRSFTQNFKEENGCLYKKNPNPEGRAWLLVVPKKRRKEVMSEYHNHMLNGHLGVARTTYRLKNKYYWPSMLKDVSEFVKTCHLCQSRKGSNHLPSGLLQPIPPANYPFERIGIDFVGPLPSTKRRRKWIIVLTDYYTKYAETKAVSEATVKEVSTFLIEHIILRHGAPRFLISDRGSQFTSNLMKEVMKMCKVKHCFTTSYHPQTNGLTERLNRTLINMISMYVNTDQKNWDEILPFITHAYNTTIQETTGYSPFFLLFGREPMSLLDDENIPTDSNMDDYDEYIENYLDKIARTRQVVINNTEKTQERMKRNYDKKHNEKIYEPGHLVAVWTPVRKIGKCEKLLRKYFGPYRILKKLSNVNYLIEPKDNPGQDPLIVHVSRLKPYFERIDEVTHEDVTTSGEGEVMVETRSGKMQDPAQERIKAEESAKPQPGATIGRDASSDPVVLNPNIDIPKYDGTEDPRPWIESLEEIGFLYHWADYIISRYAAMNMIGSAKTWLNLHKVSFTSWENFKSRLIEDFASDANKEEMRMRLNRIQQWNEPAIRFAEDILVLCNKVDPQMEEDTKINWVIGGLKKEYSFALHLNPPKNTNELLEICKKLDLFEKNYQERAEKSKALYYGPRSPRPHHQEQWKNATSFRRPYQNTSKPQAPAPRYYQNTSKPQAPTPRYYQKKPLPQVSAPRRSYTPNPEPKPVYPSKTYNKNPNSNRNRTEDGRPICFKCNKPGHVARYCRVRFVRIVEEDPIVTQDKVEEEIRMDNGTQKSRPLLYSDPAEVNLMEESEQKEHEEPQFQINENLAYTEKEQLKQVLERYEDLFSSGLGRSNLAKHRIDTEGAKPIKHKPYRVSAKEREIIKEQIDEMLRDGIIRPSSSPWSFPVILVKKRDGKYRFCVDYRKLNDVTVKDVYPIPRIDEVLDTLQGSKYFSAIDLKSGYWQVEVEEKDKEKTAFTTAHGLYEFNVMPFGLCNAPATFERNMENMLGNLRWQICLCYLDDVFIYSSDFSTHLKRIEAVLKCFREANLKLNNKKCQFAFEELEILGHITNQHGIKPAEHNIKAIRDFPRPKKIKEVQSFLGMCSYYRKFIKGFSKIADPLTSLIKKNVPFTWTENQEKAFQTLKVALINPPILGHFDPNAITYIHTDASNIGLGATLVQKFGDKEKVISYLSRTLRKPEQNYSTTEKECLAVVWSMSKGPLPENEWDDDYERLFLNQIIDEKDDFIENIKENLSGNKRSITQNFKEENGCLYKKNPNPEGRAWLLVVPKKRRKEVMSEYHNHMLNGHLGVARTTYRLKNKYYWPSMLKDVSEFVKTCHLCQSRKGSNHLPSGLLQPIPPANYPFERIGIDFVGPLPSTKRRRKWIIVLTDYYTKYAETKAVSEATVKEVSTFLIEHIILRHGAPRFLISDRGSQFTSNLMKEVMKMCKVKHCFTTSYHPQTNGLTERLNRTLIYMISMYVNTDQKNWDEILPFITHAYNTTIQETTGYSPFFLLFGREPMSLLDDENIPTDSNMDDYDEYIENYLDKIARTRQVVINNTEKTQERMKRNYDKKHNEKIYEPGHLVAVWTPVRKIGKCEKLLRKYFGPYRILKKLSNVNYLIEPKDNPGQDPLIVHVSRLKPYFERIDEVTHED